MTIIWKAELDSEDGVHKYDCKVVRIRDYVGQLTVIDIDTKEKIIDEEVDLTYNAIVGADIMDISLWEEKILSVIDGGF
jgi:hypothetical protein